jgi:hypothetical protein
MKYTVEMALCGIIYIPSFMMIGSGIREIFKIKFVNGGIRVQTHRHQGDLISIQTHRHQGDLISILLFFQVRKVG